jgi:hypothetical protein
MKIGVMSDSHDNLPAIRRALARFEAEGAEAVIHAGDFVAPFAIKELLKFKGAIYGCFGNNDGEKAGIRALWPAVAEPPCELQLGGRRILLTHDEAALQKTPDLLRRAEVVIFGHSHHVVPGERSGGGPLRLNPGECGGWLTGLSTVAILDTATLDVRILEI